MNVGFVKPVAQPRADGGPDRSTALVAATTMLRPPDPLSTARLEHELGAGRLDALLEKIVAAWQPVQDRSDLVVVEGLSPGPARLYAGGLNQALAQALDADVLLVGSWPPESEPNSVDSTVEGVAETLAITGGGYWSGEQARVVGCVVNGLPESLADPIMVATMMLKQGDMDGMVAGAVHTTAATVRPALQILGTKPGSRLVSSVFFMCLPDEVVVYGDCAINPRPDAEDLADIAIQSAASAHAFGIEPRVARWTIQLAFSGDRRRLR